MEKTKLIKILIDDIVENWDDDIDNILIMDWELVSLWYFIGKDQEWNQVSCLPSENSKDISQYFNKKIK